MLSFLRKKKQKLSIIPNTTEFCMNKEDSESQPKPFYIKTRNNKLVVCPLTLEPIRFDEAALIFCDHQRYAFFHLQTLIDYFKATACFDCVLTKVPLPFEEIQYIEERSRKLRIRSGGNIYSHVYANKTSLAVSQKEQQNIITGLERMIDKLFAVVYAWIFTLQGDPYYINPFEVVDNSSEESDDEMEPIPEAMIGQMVRGQVVDNMTDLISLLRMLHERSEETGNICLQRCRDKLLKPTDRQPDCTVDSYTYALQNLSSFTTFS